MKTIQEKIAVMQAAADGKKIQCSQARVGVWVNTEIPLWDWNNYDYQIKPEPKLRPWNPEEVPVGAICDGQWILGKKRPSLIVSVEGTCFCYCGRDKIYTVTFEAALRDFTYSLDQGKTWLPCGVMEVEK